MVHGDGQRRARECLLPVMDNNDRTPIMRCMTSRPSPCIGLYIKQWQQPAYWIVERLTEEFGPCELGWGFSILSGAWSA
jgi:hypothetical protein